MSLAKITALAIVFDALVFCIGRAEDQNVTAKKTLFLPGVQPSGAVLLPNQWSLRPAGLQVELGDFPVNIALHPSGRWAAILHAGYGKHEIIVVDLKQRRPQISCRVTLPQTFYGICFSPDGKQVYASGCEFEVVHTFEFEEGLLGRHREIRVMDQKDKFIPAGLTVSSDRQMLYAAGAWGGALACVPVKHPQDRVTISLGKDSYPYACLLDPSGQKAFVSLWNRAGVALVDLHKKVMAGVWPAERHPTEMVLSPDGKTLFVACANSTKVCLIDAETGKTRETLSCALYPTAPAGNTPNSLCLSGDGQILFVANADANNLAVINVAAGGREPSRPLGFIPTGWYPTSVRCSAQEKKLYVVNGKGVSSRANPQGPNPLLPPNKTIREYIGSLFPGSMSVIEWPGPDKMGDYTKIAYACSPLRQDLGVPEKPDAENPIPVRADAARSGDCPIKHCIYVIKENRTYDQVLGDIKEGNGDPNLCIFPESVTPNHHRLARQFVLLDNFYVDGEVSADGHQWSMGAHATDFVEKLWPLSYRGSPLKKLDFYPSEGNFDDIARPAGGYIWDRCADAHVSYRSYGEWIGNGKTPRDPGRASVPALKDHFDPWYRGFDLDYSEQKRADRFLEEVKRFEREGDMPQLVILRLPNDHTAGARIGAPTPTAYLADNDLALGRVVEGVSKSKFWKDTAFFVVEDDAQNGSDHVDAHRTVALVVSPYTKHGAVDSSLYSTSSMLRTMELILGLKPMSQFDAAARPMYRSFQAKADFSPYEHAVPRTDMGARNTAMTWGANLSSQFDLRKEDAVDDLVFNEVVWRSVRGPNSPMPAPIHAAFVMPHSLNR
jgi:DNA-binding beta-propeller fold protein YncE